MIIHWLAHWLGMDNLAGPVYGALSGWVGDVAIISGVATLVRRLVSHHKASAAQAERHHLERQAQATAQHNELKHQAERHHQQLLDQAQVHHEALKSLPVAPVKRGKP